MFYPKDVNLPAYLKNLKEPVVFISESFDGKPSVDDLAAGRFLSQKTHGVFVTSPCSELMVRMDMCKSTWFFSVSNGFSDLALLCFLQIRSFSIT